MSINEIRRGAPTAPVEKIGDSKKQELNIHSCLMIGYLALLNLILRPLLKMQTTCILTAGLRISVINDTEGQYERYDLYFEDGIKSYVQFLNLDEKVTKRTLSLNKQEDDVIVGSIHAIYRWYG